jgi:hypothetical protein
VQSEQDTSSKSSATEGCIPQEASTSSWFQNLIPSFEQDRSQTPKNEEEQLAADETLTHEEPLLADHRVSSPTEAQQPQLTGIGLWFKNLFEGISRATEPAKDRTEAYASVTTGENESASTVDYSIPGNGLGLDLGTDHDPVIEQTSVAHGQPETDQSNTQLAGLPQAAPAYEPQEMPSEPTLQENTTNVLLADSAALSSSDDQTELLAEAAPVEKTAIGLWVNNILSTKAVPAVAASTPVTTVSAAAVSTAASTTKAPKTKAPVKDVAEAADQTAIAEVNALTLKFPSAAGSAVALAKLDTSEDIGSEEPVTKMEVNARSDKKVLSFASSAAGASSISWRVEKNWDNNHPGECRISTPTIQVNQGDYSAQLWLDVIDGKLIVNTSANIDINLPTVGIAPKNGELIQFATNGFPTSAVWSGDLQKTLAKHKFITISLSGNDTGGNNLVTSLNLDSLKKAYPAYRNCNKSL